MYILVPENMTETEEIHSNADNLTSLHEVLLDEREMVSNDDKFSCSSNTYYELAPTYENVTINSANNSNPVIEKEINELCKVQI